MQRAQNCLNAVDLRDGKESRQLIRNLSVDPMKYTLSIWVQYMDVERLQVQTKSRTLDMACATYFK